MQVQIIKEKSIPGYKSPYINMYDCARQIIRTNGLRGPYQGVIPHLLRNIPGGALHLGTFELIAQYIAKQKGITKSQLTMWENMAAGGIGGFCFWSIMFPIDVVKSAIQTDSIHKSERKYKGTLNTIKQLWNEGGIKRFYRGYSPCLMRSVPANGVMLWTVAAITEAIKIQ